MPHAINAPRFALGVETAREAMPMAYRILIAQSLSAYASFSIRKMAG